MLSQFASFLLEVGDDTWVDIGCLILSDVSRGIHLTGYTQPTSVESRFVDALKAATLDPAFIGRINRTLAPRDIRATAFFARRRSYCSQGEEHKNPHGPEWVVEGNS